MKNKLVSAAFKSATAYILLMTIVTIVAELFLPLKSFLANLTGHHWTAKGVLGVILFIALTIIFTVVGKAGNVSRNMSITIGSTIVGATALLVFYVIHYFM
jgi:hypothetical protein